MKDTNLRAVDRIMGKLKKEVKCRAQITRSGPSAHALSDPSRRLQKAMNKLVREERIQQLASLLAELRTEIPLKNLKKIVATLMRLHRQSPPDESELAPRETLRALIQALEVTNRLQKNERVHLVKILREKSFAPKKDKTSRPREHECERTSQSAPFCHICGRLIGGF